MYWNNNKTTAVKWPALLLLMASCLLLTTCRKGEDDPAFSLRTRKARVTGDWNMVSGRAAITSFGNNVTYMFDHSEILFYGITRGVIYFGPYQFSMSIRPDGRFVFREILMGEVTELEGYWNFNTGAGEARNKEVICFTVDQVIKGRTYGPNFFNRYSPNFSYTIRELRNKKLVLQAFGKVSADTTGYYETLTTEYTLQQ